MKNDTSAETWMKGKTCGRLAFLALQDHYDGKAEGERRKAVVRADLEKIFYRNEATFPFETFVTKLQHIFNVLEKYGMPEYEQNKSDLYSGRYLPTDTGVPHLPTGSAYFG